MFNQPTRRGISVLPRVFENKNKEKMSAPNNAYYVLTQAHAGLPNSSLFSANFAAENLANLATKSHTDLTDIGTNAHSAIDTHIADSTIHFLEGSIDHGALQGRDDDDHTQYILVDGSRAFTGSVTIGDGAATNYTMSFVASNFTGVYTWDNINDCFAFDDDIKLNVAERLYFRDLDIFMYSNADGELTIEADIKTTIGKTGTTLLGSATDHVAVSSTGDTVFVGSAGLSFGQISAHSASAGITSVAQNDWDQITAFDTNGETNNTTPDHTSDDITITKEGRYLVNWQWSGNGPAASHDWDFHIALNNRVTDQPQTSAHLETPSAQNLVSASGNGIIDCAVDDTVELWVQRLSAGNNIVLTTENCSITLTQIGGT